MLVLILSWFVLTCASCLFGAWLLAVLEGQSTPRPHAIIQQTLICGLLGQALLTLACSLITPISWAFALCMWGAIVLLAFSNKQARKILAEILRSGRSEHRNRSVPILTLLIFVSLYASQVPCNYDTLLYHHQATKWCAEHGAVRGMGLIHFRFGFVSSWLTLAAPWESLFPGRSANVLNGLLLWWSLSWLTGAMGRVLKGISLAPDYFVSAGLSVVLGLHLLFLEPASQAPDFAVNVLTVVMASWFLFESNERKTLVPIAVWWTAVLLATIKLSTLSVIAVLVFAEALMFLRHERWTRENRSSSIERLFKIPFILLLAVIPIVLFSWTTTGGYLFPVPSLMSDVPWALGIDEAIRVNREITEWARWGGVTPNDATEWNWISSWLRSSKGILFCLLASGNVVAIAFLVVGKLTRRDWATTCLYWIPALLGIFSAAYLILTAPNPRFGFGVLSLGWCSLSAIILQNIFKAPRPRSETAASASTLSRMMVAGIISGGLLALIIRPLDPWRRALNDMQDRPIVAAVDGQLNWLLPNSVPSVAFAHQQGGGTKGAFEVELVRDRVNNLEYVFPRNSDICGPAPLPAAWRQLHGIQMIDPAVGLRAGFTNSAADSMRDDSTD